MSRLLLARVLRALLAVWFVLSVGEPSVVHICPMHASAAAELANAHGFAGHHAQHGAPTHSHSSRQHEHLCTCISCCVGSGSSALAATRVPLELPRLVAVDARVVSRGDVLALEDPPYLLPPGTGPPRA